MSIRHYGPAGLLLLASSVMPPLGMLVLLGSITQVVPWLRSHGTWGPLIAIVAFSVMGGLAIVPTFSFAVVCGWAFGAWGGCGVGITAVAGATLIGNGVGRLAAAGVPQLLGRYPRLAAVVHALVHASPSRAGLLIFLLRVPVIAPFAIVNAVLALVGTRLIVLVPATMAGMIPRTAAGAWFGATLATIDPDTLTSQPKEVWLLVLSAAAVIAVLAVVGWVTTRTLRRMVEPA